MVKVLRHTQRYREYHSGPHPGSRTRTLATGCCASEPPHSAPREGHHCPGFAFLSPFISLCFYKYVI